MKWNGREDELVLTFLGGILPIRSARNMILECRRLKRRVHAQDRWEARNHLVLCGGKNCKQT